MNLSKFRFTLDLHSIQSQASIPVMVGDTSVTLIITITDGGLPYHIEDGCLAKISIKRPTGTHLEEFCIVKNNAVVEYAFSQNENTCAVPGVHICDIILYGADGGVVGTPRFTMVVSERVIRFDDIVLTDEDFTASEAMMKQEAVRQEQERLRVIAEEKRVSAEEERVNAGKVALQAVEDARAEADRAAEAANQAGGDTYSFKVSETKPNDTRCIWFNTSGVIPTDDNTVLNLTNNFDGGMVAEVNGINYGVGNITGDDESTPEYDYTII